MTLNWIKAHHGHEGNELADEYAKMGSIDTSNYHLSLTTKAEINGMIETKTREYWTQKWQQYQHCRQTKYFYPAPSEKLYKKVNKLSRSNLSILIQIVTG